jgi:cell division septation protein DedD
LADGSVVKLGNGAVLKRDVQGFDASPSVAPSKAATDKAAASKTAPNQIPANQATAGATTPAEPVEKDLYRGALAVVEGAFRYSTTLLSAEYRRAMTIKTGNVATIGIRGTDLWGRASSDSSFVALIEGNIGITTTDGTETRLDKPLLAFQADQNSPSGKRFAVELEDVLALAPETELDQGEGILVKNGPFAVHLTSFSHKSEALALRNQLLKQGYAADTSNFNSSEQPWFRVSVRGFASLADARSFSAMAKTQGMANSPWVDNNL